MTSWLLLLACIDIERNKELCIEWRDSNFSSLLGAFLFVWAVYWQHKSQSRYSPLCKSDSQYILFTNFMVIVSVSAHATFLTNVNFLKKLIVKSKWVKYWWMIYEARSSELSNCILVKIWNDSWRILKSSSFFASLHRIFEIMWTLFALVRTDRLPIDCCLKAS